MEYLKGGKRICDSPVWQLHNKNYKLGGTRLTNRSGDNERSFTGFKEKECLGQSEREEKIQKGG